MSKIEEDPRAKSAEPVDDLEPLDSRGILELLMDESQDHLCPEENREPDIDGQEQDTARLHEYVLPASALRETRTLEELADMATGSYKYEPPKDDSTVSPEDYFHHTRKQKILRMD